MPASSVDSLLILVPDEACSKEGGSEIRLKIGDNIIGRNALTGLRDARISRRHAVVTVAADGRSVTVQLISKNLPEEDASQPKELGIGESFELLFGGLFRYTVREAEAPAAAAAAAANSCGGSSTDGGRSGSDGTAAATAAAAATSKHLNSLAEELYCCICHDLMVESLLLECGHAGCSSCLTQWLKFHRGCPSCRTVLTSKKGIPGRAIDNVIEKLVNSGELSADDTREYLERKAQLAAEKEAATWAGRGGRGGASSVKRPRGSPPKRGRGLAGRGGTVAGGRGGTAAGGRGVMLSAGAAAVLRAATARQAQQRQQQLQQRNLSASRAVIDLAEAPAASSSGGGGSSSSRGSGVAAGGAAASGGTAGGIPAVVLVVDSSSDEAEMPELED